MNTIPFCHVLITFSDEVPCQSHRAHLWDCVTTCDTQYIVGLGPLLSPESLCFSWRCYDHKKQKWQNCKNKRKLNHSVFSKFLVTQPNICKTLVTRPIKNTCCSRNVTWLQVRNLSHAQWGVNDAFRQMHSKCFQSLDNKISQHCCHNLPLQIRTLIALFS